jgi:hypothetical protein
LVVAHSKDIKSSLSRDIKSSLCFLGAHTAARDYSNPAAHWRPHGAAFCLVALVVALALACANDRVA